MLAYYSSHAQKEAAVAMAGQIWTVGWAMVSAASKSQLRHDTLLLVVIPKLCIHRELLLHYRCQIHNHQTLAAQDLLLNKR